MVVRMVHSTSSLADLHRLVRAREHVRDLRSSTTPALFKPFTNTTFDNHTLFGFGWLEIAALDSAGMRLSVSIDCQI